MSKYAQAVISQTTDGKWKLTVQSDKQVEAMLIGSFEDIVKELKHAATRDWERRS
jgi:subtilisin-like proprotein convertase family protein